MRQSSCYATWLVGVGLLCAAPVAGNPEMLPPAMKYGARDCGFCHVSAGGGTGHNERGLWLIEERKRRGADAVDADWLAARETVAARSPRPTRVDVRPAELPPLKPRRRDRRRTFDYTTAHGDWPAYGGDLGARKYAPLPQINADNVSQLRIAWVWEAFDNHRASQRGKTPDRFMVTPLMVGACSCARPTRRWRRSTRSPARRCGPTIPAPATGRVRRSLASPAAAWPTTAARRRAARRGIGCCW